MANIDNLNFKVILDDKQFNEKIAKLEKDARKFNTNMSNLLNVQKASQTISQQELENNRRTLQAKVDEVRAQEKINREKIKTDGLQGKINAQIDRATKGYERQNGLLKELKGYAMGYFSLRGVTSLLSSMVSVTGEFEMQKTTLAAMLGDLGKAEEIITRIKGLAVQSPFQFKELTTYAKQLSAFSVPAAEIFETTKMLADISAGLGVGMDRIILAYGQVRSAAFLRGQEVRQFTEAGIPILEELAEMFSEIEGRAVSAGEVFDKISARLVPFEMVSQVFKNMTSEGGKFFNMQAVQAETLKGKISNLRDAYEIMLNEIGEDHSDALKNVVDWMSRLMKDYEKTGRVLIELIATYGVYRTTLFLANNMQSTFAGTMGMMLEKFSISKRLMSVNPYTAISAGVTGLIGLMYKLGKEFSRQSVITESLTKSQERLHTEIGKELGLLDALKAKLELAEEGTDEYNSALSAIQRNYAPYLKQLEEEGVAIDTLAGLYENLKEKIQEAAHERFVAYARQDLDEAYAQRVQEVISGSKGQSRFNLSRMVDDLDLTQAEETALRMYITGVSEWEEIAEKYTDLTKKIEDANTRVSLGPGSEGPKQAKEYLEILKSTIQGATDEYSNAITVVEQFAVAVRNTNSGAAETTTKFVETVQKTLKGFGATKENKGIFGSLWAENDTEYYGYLEKIRKEYQEIDQKIKDVGNTQKHNLPDLKKQKEAMEAIAMALGVSLSHTGGSGNKSPEQIELEAQIDLVKKLQGAYEKLNKYVDDNVVKTLLTKYFPQAKTEWIESLDFTGILEDLAIQLEKYDKDAADRLRGSIGEAGVDAEVDRLKELEDNYQKVSKAAKDYYESIRKWQAADFSIEGEGVAFDIGKIASDLNSKFNDIELNAKKITETFNQIDISDATALDAVKRKFESDFGEGTWDIFYEEFIQKGEQAIEDFSKKEKEYERKLAQEKLNDIAERHVREATEGMDMSHWGEKSISQIEAIRQRLMTLMEEDIELPQSTTKKLKQLGLTTEDLKIKIAELFSEKLDNATVEKFKALSKVINQTASVAKDLGDDLIALGETMDSETLTGIGKSLHTFEELTKTLTECDSLMLAMSKSTEDASESTEGAAESTQEMAESLENVASSSDWITMAIKLVASLISNVINGINDSQVALIEARNAALEYENALKQIEYDNLMESFNSIFGASEYSRAIEAMKKAAEYQQQALDATKEIETTSRDIQDALSGMSGWATFSKNAQDMADMVKGLGLGDILVDERSAWQKYWGGGNDLVWSVNIGDFLDEGGKLKGEELREWLQQYGEHISQDNKEVLEGMLKDYDLYTQSIEEATNYLENVFGNVADSMADAFIEAFKKSGDAALDYAEIMDEIATNIAQSVIKSMLVDEIFSPEKVNQVADLLLGGDHAGAMAIVDEAMKEAQSMAPHFQEFLESLEPYFQMGGEDESSSLGAGIKGITEDTANLLASYLNAIRADVSYARTLWERMDVTTQRIATVLNGFSAPTLVDYQKRIEANTYNTALNTQSILSELQSVITSEGGLSAIRTYS